MLYNKPFPKNILKLHAKTHYIKIRMEKYNKLGY
jgi:hypothetical protein